MYFFVAASLGTGACRDCRDWIGQDLRIRLPDAGVHRQVAQNDKVSTHAIVIIGFQTAALGPNADADALCSALECAGRLKARGHTL